MTRRSAAAADPEVDRRLVDGQEAGLWRYQGHGNDGYHLVVPAGGKHIRRTLPLDEMRAYLDWYDLAAASQDHGAAAGVDDEGDEPTRLAGAIARELLASPSLPDMLRLAIWDAMERATPALTMTALADAAGVTRQSVRSALCLGPARTLTMTMAERLMTAAGGGWTVGHLATTTGSDVLVADPGRPEPVGLRRLRALALVQAAGLIARWRVLGAGEHPTPQSVYRAPRVELRRASVAAMVEARFVPAACAALVDRLAPGEVRLPT